MWQSILLKIIVCMACIIWVTVALNMFSTLILYCTSKCLKKSAVEVKLHPDNHYEIFQDHNTYWKTKNECGNPESLHVTCILVVKCSNSKRKLDTNKCIKTQFCAWSGIYPEDVHSHYIPWLNKRVKHLSHTCGIYTFLTKEIAILQAINCLYT